MLQGTKKRNPTLKWHNKEDTCTRKEESTELIFKNIELPNQVEFSMYRYRVYNRKHTTT